MYAQCKKDLLSLGLTTRFPDPFYPLSRSYNPTLGRFASMDDIVLRPSDTQNANLYAYVAGDPVNASDPTGHGIVDTLASVGVIGLLASMLYLSVTNARATFQAAQHHVVAGPTTGGMRIDNQMANLVENVNKIVANAPSQVLAQIRDTISFSHPLDALGSFDVTQLYDSGFNSPSSNIFNLYDSHFGVPHRDVFAMSGTEPGTVTWLGSVYDSDDVNYYFFGVLVAAMDRRDGTDSEFNFREKIYAYRQIVEQGDKANSRMAMFEAGYYGRGPNKNVSVGGPIKPNSIDYPGAFIWEVRQGGSIILTGSASP